MISGERRLNAAEFHRLRDVLPEIEWFANIRNPNTRRSEEEEAEEGSGGGRDGSLSGVVQPTTTNTIARTRFELPPEGLKLGFRQV